MTYSNRSIPVENRTFDSQYNRLCVCVHLLRMLGQRLLCSDVPSIQIEMFLLRLRGLVESIMKQERIAAMLEKINPLKGAHKEADLN